MRIPRVPRKTAKQVIESMVADYIKNFDKLQAGELPTMVHPSSRDWEIDHIRATLFAIELISIRMDWDQLKNRLKKWRSDSLREGLLTSTPQPPDDQNCEPLTKENHDVATQR